MTDRYRAAVLSVQTLELQREEALRQSELSETDISAMKFDEEKILTLLKHYPAGMIISQFVENKEALALLEAAKEFSVEGFGAIANQTLKERLNKRRRLLASFYLEYQRISADNSPSFSDNLMLELTDFIMQAVPLLIVFESNSRLSTVAILAAKVAAEIRAQIAWGLVSDWELFRHDVIMLGNLVLEMDELLGNNVRDFSSFEELDMHNTPQLQDSLYAMQAIVAYRETFGI